MAGVTSKYEINNANKGKREHQKIKPYIVLEYLMRNSDEQHAIPAPDIVSYLQEDCGIDAERRSVYRDIDEINKVLYMLENECTIQEAEEVIDSEDGEEEKFIVYDKNKKGFYVRQRKYDANDIRLLAECVYSARFIDEKRAKRLAKLTGSFVSQWQADDILHDAFLVDRTKTTNTAVYYSVDIINQAMSRGSSQARHTPEKISFKYLKYRINDRVEIAERRKGAAYVVSPYKLLINDGNYYLLAYDSEAEEMRTYRVDRMKEVSLTGLPRDGEDEFHALNLESYTQRVFGMFSGTRRRLTIRFINPLLDTVIDRFGTKGVSYSKLDETHFTVSVEVEISDQFFSWVCGFGNKAKILGPDFVVDEFREFLNRIKATYE